jgi:hypothetical protein
VRAGTNSTMAEISISIENKYFGGEHKVITLPRYNFMFFYVFKIVVAIASLCINASD